MKKGILISIIGIISIFLIFMMDLPNSIERYSLIFFCIFFILFGILIETPLIKNITERIYVDGNDGPLPKGWNSEKY